MYLVLIFTPLLASILSGFFGRKLGVSGAQWITCSSVVITTLLSIVVFFEVAINNIPVTFELFTWIDSESLNILWGFNFDALTASMLIPVLIVSSLVHIYSIGYMSHDPHNQRFFSYLSLFTFMMIILVTANNYLLMFVGWEGVGVCSYLLVSFWFTRIAANQSSISAFLTNRVGDCFLTLGLFAMLWTFGNIDYTTVFSLSPYISENIITLIGICLLIGAMAKSSQVGLHVWLPMAMEGPTPVSALIHAATMVTAGVYLLMRSSPLIEYSSTVLLLCLWIGGLTTVFSSLIGLFQQDIKKVIAYSTMSQLGMMVIAIGLSSYNIALFHLVNHAFYKGLLFLGAGSVIHAVADNQDFRRYGGLKAFLPLTYSVMLIASLSLVAFPYMTGFYSKDLILESAYGQFCFSSVVIYFIAVVGAMFTTLYSVKVLYLTFLTNPNGPLISYKHAHEGDIFMSLPLIILALFSIFFGYITKDLFIGLGTSLFQDNSIFIYPLHEILIETEFAVPTFFKLLPLFFTLFLTFISIICSEFFPNLLIRFKFTRIGYNIFGFFNQRLLVELFYNTYITDVILKLGGQTTKVIDKGAIEYIGPYGLELALTNLSRNIHKLDSSVITNYALYILSGLIVYILITYFSLSVTPNLIYKELFILLAFITFSLSSYSNIIKEELGIVYLINSYNLRKVNKSNSLVVVSLIHGVEVSYENIVTGAMAITSVLVVLGGRHILKVKERIRTEVKKRVFYIHIQPVAVTWPNLGNTVSFLAIIDLLDPTGANLKIWYSNLSEYPSLIVVTIMRHGVPTVAIVNRATKWRPSNINWNLMPHWAIAQRLETVGHFGHDSGTPYNFPAPSLPIWHSLIANYNTVEISTGSLNNLHVPIGAWCLAHPHGVGIHIPYGLKSIRFVPVLLLPQSVYTHPISNSMIIDYYSQSELEVFDVISTPL